MTRPFTIDRAMRDKNLLGAALGDIATWATWLTILKAAFGEKLTSEEIITFAAVAGNRDPPKRRVRELWCLIGRRGGKSRIAAALAVYFACFVKHRLAAGEHGMALVLAASEQQARVVFGYAKAFLTASPVLRQEIDAITRGEIRLKNGITIAIHANGFRTVRGRTLIAAIFDEVAFWRDDTSATPDAETYTAVLPALLTTGGPLIGISSPYRKTGLLHAKHRRYFGVSDDDVLVVQGASRTFNPSLSDAAIAAQREADPTAASSEWDALFRDDISTFIDDKLIEAAIDHGRPLELPPSRAHAYKAFVDPSGLAVGGDAYTLAIAHKQDGRFVIDAVRSRSGPADPGEVTREYAALCDEYQIGAVVGDAYAREWVESAWHQGGLVYVRSELTASELYLEALPLFSRGLVSLPDHSALLRELRLLERAPTRMGKDQVTHPRSCHDDLANVVCGVLRNLSEAMGYNLDSMGFDDTNLPPPRQWQHTPQRPSDEVLRYQAYCRSFAPNGGWGL